MALSKPSVTIDGVPLAAVGSIVWQTKIGVSPYQTTMTVHKSHWNRLKSKLGKPVTLIIKDSRGVEKKFQKVYILHETVGDAPSRVSFLVSDRRWLWPYKLVVRDFNITRKTGELSVFGALPEQTAVVRDQHRFLTYSLKKGEQVWSAKDALEEVLKILESRETSSGLEAFRNWVIESFPIRESRNNSGEEGQFTLQNIVLRDSGEAALSRILGYIPGAEVYINEQGKAVIFDAADLEAPTSVIRGLPPATWDSDNAVLIDREAIRPKMIIIHYQREIECMFEFKDNYDETQAGPLGPDPDSPFLENVVQTTDLQTDIIEFDPLQKKDVTKTVPAGTWVSIKPWLKACNERKPDGSQPWTFNTISHHWAPGTLESALGANGLTDLDDKGDVLARVGALKTHFRQTFRINRKYVELFREIKLQRVTLLDPVTGAHSPAGVWGQAAIMPSSKGIRIAANRTGDDDKQAVYRNVDYLAQSNTGEDKNVVDTGTSPASVTFEEDDIGIIHVRWIASSYGTEQTIIPCHMTRDGSSTPFVVVRDLAFQDDDAVMHGSHIESGSNSITLSTKCEMKILLTVVPAAPNNTKQFHTITIEPPDVEKVFQKEIGVSNGDGPKMLLFVPPGELTARFGWQKDSDCLETIKDLFGFLPPKTNSDGSQDLDEPGIDGNELKGFILSNEKHHLADHALSYATEVLSEFADAWAGSIVTRMPGFSAPLQGNTSGVTFRVAAAPSGKIDTVTTFTGQQRSFSRMALLPAAARQIILGTLPF